TPQTSAGAARLSIFYRQFDAGLQNMSRRVAGYRTTSRFRSDEAGPSDWLGKTRAKTKATTSARPPKPDWFLEINGVRVEAVQANLRTLLDAAVNRGKPVNADALVNAANSLVVDIAGANTTSGIIQHFGG